MKTTLFPYSDLGNLLKRWRIERYSSASKMIADARFDFSYGAYAAFERGEQLPSAAVLEQIAKFLDRDIREALFVWAQVQMPNEKLKSYFKTQVLISETSREGGLAKPIQSNSIPPSEFDNTWVYGSSEKQILEKHPWMIELLIRLSAIYPEELSFKELGMDGSLDADTQKTLEQAFQFWKENGNIILTKTGVRLALPHVHMPKTEPWKELRELMLKRALKSMLPQLTPEAIRNKTVYRTNINRVLTKEQQEYWMQKLAANELEFSTTPYLGKEDPNPKENYMMLVLFTPRPLKIP